jgi:hypothetical protein
LRQAAQGFENKASALLSTRTAFMRTPFFVFGVICLRVISSIGLQLIGERLKPIDDL